MQATSDLYRQILSSDNHWFETRVSIGGVNFSESSLFALSTHNSMFAGDPEIGKAIAGEIDVRILAPGVTIPQMAQIIPYVRICNATAQSEWIQRGVFYIDTRETTRNGNGLDILSIHGYDAMLFAEQLYPSTTHEWPMVDTAVVQEMADAMGVTVDPRTYDLMNAGYMIPLPGSYSIREVLGYIASMYVGSFIMTETGLLRLVSILELPNETNYLIDNAGDAITFGGDRILV